MLDTPARSCSARRRLRRRRHPAEIIAAPGIDFDHVSLIEEERHLDDRTRLERGWLGAARRGIPPDSRVGFHDLQLDEVRQLHRHRALIDEQDLDLGVLLEKVARLADLIRRERDLVIGLEIHEVIAVILVEILHALLVEVHQLDLFTGAERVVDDSPELHVLELGAYECSALAGLDVLEIDDAVGFAIKFDLQALLELRGRDLHDPHPFRFCILMRKASSSFRRASACPASLRSRRRKIWAASSTNPCSRQMVAKLIVANVSSARRRPSADPPAGWPPASRTSSKTRDSRSDGSSDTAWRR